MNQRLPRLLEHDDFIILHKPSGVPMHDAENGIISRLRAETGDRAWYLCHRLDTGTSGCLCVAKSATAAATIGEQFAASSVQKFYLALTHTKPIKKQGTIVGDMKNRRRGQYMLMKSRHNPAVSQFFSYGIDNGIRGVIVRPYTGKTHQIRVALKSVGSPILGDDRYGGNPSDRLYLHAWQLRFQYNGTAITASCLPASGQHYCDQAVRQWLDGLPMPDTLAWPKLKMELNK